jgi:hypothetical protein
MTEAFGVRLARKTSQPPFEKFFVFEKFGARKC